MGKSEKLILKILRGTSDNNIPFDQLCNLLKKLGFAEKTRESHHNFRKPGVVERINLQCDGNNAKEYQVRQVREIVTKYKLGGNGEL